MKTHLMAAACLALGATVSAQTTPAAPAPAASQQEAAHSFVLYPAGKVLGLDVHNDSQKNLGEIGDLLIDPKSGEIRFAVIDVGGFLGMGEDHRVVPWGMIQVVVDEKDAEKLHARTTLTEDQVKSAPKQKREDKKITSDLDKRIETAFGKDERWAYAGKGEPIFVWCRQMDGVTLKDPNNKEVGKVQRLVLAPANNCVAYVVVDTTKEAGDRHIAVPFQRVEYSFDKDNKLTATTPVDIARFATAPEYESKDWKRMSGTAYIGELSTYYNCDPFWKSSRFASTRKEPVKGD